MKPAYRVAMAAIAAILASCSKAPPTPASNQTITFSVLSAEDQQSMARVWQPLFDDMSKATGLTIKPFYAANYASLVEAMRFNQTQVGWFAALSALEATRRANGEVISRVLTNGPNGAYQSVLIARKDSGITLDDRLARRGADRDPACLDAHERQFRQSRNVHETRRPGEPHRHHRHERLSAGDGARVGIGREHRDGFRGIRWPRIFERRGLHGRSGGGPAPQGCSREGSARCQRGAI